MMTDKQEGQVPKRLEASVLENASREPTIHPSKFSEQ